MKFMVTGGAGFIGSHITEALCGEGHEVIVIDNFSSGKKENLNHINRQKLKVHEGDIKDKDFILKNTKNLDGIFHEAALVSVSESIENPVSCYENNIKGTLHILEACRINGVKRVVFASSSAIYGDNPNLPLKESEIPNPISPYGLSKLNNEQLGALYHKLFDINITALRYFNVFGPRQDHSSPYSGVISIFMNRIRNDQGITIYGDGRQTRDFIFVKDVVQANLKAMFSNNKGFHIYNVGTGRKVSLNEMLSVFEEVSGKKVSKSYNKPRIGDIRHSFGNIRAIEENLGFDSLWSFKKGLQNLFDFN